MIFCGQGHRGPRPSRRLWLSSSRSSIGWWSVIVCLVAVLQNAQFVTAEGATKQDDAYSTGATNFTSDFVEGMDPFWFGSLRLVHEIEMFESWFNDAKASTELITAMLHAIPFSNEADRERGTGAKLRLTERAVREREENLVKAKQEFNKFLALRKQIVHAIFADRTMWYYHADGGKEIQDLLQLAVSLQRNLDSASVAEAGSDGRSRQEAACTNAAERASRIVVNILQAQWDIWKYQDADLEMLKHLAAALKHVECARSFEFQALANLKVKSRISGLWEASSHDLFLLRLEKKLREAEKWAKELVTSLYWARSHVSTVRSRIPEGRAREWTTRMQRLLQGWGLLLEASNQGMLFSLRREELKAVGKEKLVVLLDFDKSWADWKYRNCGGTSCFDDEGIVHRILKAFGVSYMPLARRAGDEVAWCKKRSVPTRPTVWRGTYEDACCKTGGDVATFLKYGPMLTMYSPG
ncbi:hypothetical protein GGR52DRAFT_4719 [Hypoxylon sp. FL1284]|nr:hypothetical protein GGR52DRAFT_4719 [Hypoxylon sp. FL1284]